MNQARAREHGNRVLPAPGEMYAVAVAVVAQSAYNNDIKNRRIVSRRRCRARSNALSHYGARCTAERAYVVSL